MTNDFTLKGTESALNKSIATVDMGIPAATSLRGLNPGRRLDVSTPRQKIVTEAVFNGRDLVTPAVLGDWYIPVRDNEPEKGDIAVPKGCTLIVAAADEPGFAVPLAPVERPADEVVVQPVPLIDLVRAETLRRLLVAFGARDQDHLMIKVQDATIQAGLLTDKETQGETLTQEEAALAGYLRNASRLYLAIKATGNAFEAMTADTIPADWRDDSRWP